MSHHAQIHLLMFISLALLVGVSIRFILRNTRIPYTVVLLCLGIVFGIIYDSSLLNTPEHIEESLNFIAHINPHLILFVFLPVLIFESAYSLEVHLFNRALSQISLLAIVGLIIAMLLTALLMHAAFDWSWTIALMFGALISATDPVAVVALLKEMNARKRLQTLLEGESLLNDGTSVVLFSLFLTLVASAGSPEFAWQDTTIEFIRVVLLGLVTGFLTAWLTISWIRHVFNDALIEITLTIVISYLGFYIAEQVLHASGIVAVVTIALAYAGPGRSRISPEVSHFLHQFWEVMAYIANTLIFLLAGFLIAPSLAHASAEDWISLPFIFVGLIVIRALTIIVLMPLLKNLGLGINRNKAITLVWGGLRGAVALTMAIAASQSAAIDPIIASKILFFTGGIVFLSMIINATSMPALMRYLALDRLPPAKQFIINKAEVELNTIALQTLDRTRQQQLLKHANWPLLKNTLTEKISALDKAIINNNASHEDIALAFRRRMLEIERQTYWNTLKNGMIEPATAAILGEMVNTVLDHYPTIGPRQQLLNSLDAQSTLLGNISLVQRLQQKYHQLTTDRNPMHIYQLARAFLYAQNTLLNFVDTLAPDETLFHEIRDEIRLNIDLVKPVVEDLEQQHAETLRESDTQTASDVILYTQRHLIYKMHEDGLFDDAETASLVKKTENEIINLQNRKQVKSFRE